MHSQLTISFQAMTSLLGDAYDGFGNGGVVWYELMSELVAKINGYVLIDTGGVILVYEVGLFLGGILNSEKTCL